MGLELGLSTHNNTLQVLHRTIGAPHLIKTTLVSGVFSGVSVAQSLVFRVVFFTSLFVVLSILY